MDWTRTTAIWGASLSTILLLFEIYKHFSDRVKLKVTVRGGYKVHPSNTPYGDMNLITISVANYGRRPVTLSKAALLSPRRIETKKYILCKENHTNIISMRTK